MKSLGGLAVAAAIVAVSIVVSFRSVYEPDLGWHLAQGDGHRSILVAAIILGLHVLEVPLAFLMLKGRNAQPLRVIVCTLAVGLLWWVPAKRGLFAVS